MRSLSRLLAAGALGTALLGAVAVPAGAQSKGADHAVFVQNDATTGNRIISYSRADDGTLTLAHVYDTGGNGGVLNGAVVDHLASQGSLTYDARHALLYAVNAGSNTVSVFAVQGDRLLLRELVPSGGTFPVSIAVHNDLVYVLNARDGGSVQGYRVRAGVLAPITGSFRALGLDPAAQPEFTSAPGQVGFSPGGGQLIVTTKGSGQSVDVFRVGSGGRLSTFAVKNSLPGAVPFAFDFDRVGNLVLTEAGPNAVASFDLHPNGTITPIASAATNQAATCWIVGTDQNFYVSNAASASVTQVASGRHGALSAVGNTTTGGGTVDAALGAGGAFLYVQTGATGTVDEFRVNANGSLAPIGSVNPPDAAGGEGIVAV